MRKSIIYSSIAACIVVCVIFIPALTGKANLKQGKEPADWLSKVLLGNKDYRLTKTIEQPFHAIKIIGNKNQLTLDLGTGSENNIACDKPFGYEAKVENQTLIITLLMDDVFLKIQMSEPASALNFSNTSVYLRAGELKSNKLTVAANAQSSIYFTGSKSNLVDKREALAGTNSIDSLYIIAADETFMELQDLKTKSIDGQISGSELTYQPSVNTDTMRLALKGRSVVRATDRASMQQVKNVEIRGDKNYFKPHFLGNGVQLMP